MKGVKLEPRRKCEMELSKDKVNPIYMPKLTKRAIKAEQKLLEDRNDDLCHQIKDMDHAMKMMLNRIKAMEEQQKMGPFATPATKGTDASLFSGNNSQIKEPTNISSFNLGHQAPPTTPMNMDK